jgi:hypothetical protein
MKIERVPSLICENCGSYCVILTDKGFECDDCNRVTAQTSDLLKNKKDKLKLNLKTLEKIDEII